MPYYRWTGITIEGEHKSGAQSALSHEALVSILLEQDIAPLLIKKRPLIFAKKACQAVRAQLYQRLLILLRAGIRTPEALLIAAAHCGSYPLLQEFLYQSASDVKDGISLSKCIKQSALFSAFEHTLFEVGEGGNHLYETMDFVSHALGQKAVYKQKLRSALTMPFLIGIITVGLFIGIVVFLIPQFAGFLQTSNQTPNSTIARLIKMRAFILNPVSMICLATVMMCGFIGIKKILSLKTIIPYVSRIKKQIPLYQSLVNYSFLISFFYTLYLMLESGNTIEQSVSLIQAGTVNQDQELLIKDICKKIRIGIPLSSILRDYPKQFELEDAFLMQAGELSGSTGQAAKIIYEKYSKKADSILEQIHHYTQPIAITILGFFIGSIVVGIYKPILSIAFRI